MSNPETNRRSFFRIRDEILVVYRKASELPGPSDASTEPEGLEAALNTAINLVWREQPTVAEALGLLNQKLDRLREPHADDTLIIPPGLKPVRVNLSGAGMAFTTPEPLERGTRLQLLLGLLPSHTQIRIGAQVVEASTAVEGSPGSWHCKVQFDGDEQQREVLIRHVVQKQRAADSGLS